MPPFQADATTSPNSDADWIEALRRGDPRAEAWLVEEHRDRLHRAAVHFLGWQDADAEDVVQETFLQALKNLGGFRGDSKLYTWLNRICSRLCLRRLRQRRRLLLIFDNDLSQALVLPSRQPDALHRLLDTERQGQLRRGLMMMKRHSREIIECRDLRERSYVEAARELGLPLGTFMSRLARSREALRMKMDELDCGSGR